MKRILIANRGEIACRIIRAARSLGMAAIAVYSEADKSALHVEMANEAFPIGPASPRESYLNQAAILAAAAASGADAVHPGYGFLAENAAFARAVADRGLIWVGPAPSAIRDMGDKQRARDIAIAAGVPVLPGSTRFGEYHWPAIEAAGEAVGFPLLVKASAGGGGIGMKLVTAPADLAAAVETTRSAAARSFGDPTIYLERYVARARHIEVQVFGFGDGTSRHLFERDCSVQRRFQKIIEEAPAPRLDPALCQRMAETACTLANAIGYAGAGTVEFVVDEAAREFFFLEMNTRIQVEHPVTEMVTGADLVAAQLLLAGGQDPRGALGDEQISGHAIEVRLYAENPAKRFLPAPGTLTRFDLPAPAHDLRIDTGLRAGDAITPFYDPLIAKIIARGASREAAIARLRSALQGVAIEGLATNRDFLLAVLEERDFGAGNLFTAYVDEHLAGLLAAAYGVEAKP
ncbi:acetyl-CoA carboxylase biotin carboxylase subunit [Sphingorhabdus contaminans]|uniref:acetyl-CoA carboxylase biotin carboxylase subunit n=1 Tax=Sphingorhabdus contaminans TaxID=1343899 RepID=UPI003D2B22A6